MMPVKAQAIELVNPAAVALWFTAGSAGPLLRVHEIARTRLRLIVPKPFVPPPRVPNILQRGPSAGHSIFRIMNGAANRPSGPVSAARSAHASRSRAPDRAVKG